MKSAILHLLGLKGALEQFCVQTDFLSFIVCVARRMRKTMTSVASVKAKKKTKTW